MKRLRWVFLPLLLLFSIAATAQIGLYGQFSASKLNAPDTGWIYGPTIGVYFASQHFAFLSTGLDVRGSLLGDADHTVLNSALGGVRLGFKPHVIPIQPYVEGLAGVGYIEAGQGLAYIAETKFEYQLLGGLDLTVLPRIDWRLVEFSYGKLSGLDSDFDPKTISMGIVVRLP